MEGWLDVSGWLLSVLAVLGNGFIIAFIAAIPRLHFPPNWFVFSLAVADLGVGMIAFPGGYVCVSYKRICNQSIYMAVYWFLVHSSVANLCILTWDRYTAILHPLRYNTSIILRRPGRIILLAWLIPLLISLYLVLGMFAANSDTVLKVLRLTGVSGFDILCSTLFVYAVVRILAVICAQSLQNSAMESLRKQLQTSLKRASLKTAASRRPGRRKHSSAPFIIAIVVFFLACHLVKNYLILKIMFVSNVSDNAALVVTVLLVANSAANPLVYAFLKRDIKRELKRLIYCTMRRGSIKT